MLQAGEVDMITQISGVNAPSLEDAGFKRIDVPQAHDIVLILDMTNPNHPWADLKVRQALDYAIDQDAVIETIFNGQPKPAVWLMDWELGYKPEFGETDLGYDLEEAKRLMAEAGYADADGNRDAPCSASGSPGPLGLLPGPLRRAEGERSGLDRRSQPLEVLLGIDRRASWKDNGELLATVTERSSSPADSAQLLGDHSQHLVSRLVPQILKLECLLKRNRGV